MLEPRTDELVWGDELFGPGVCVRAFATEAEALEAANASRFGLSFGVFGRDLDRVLRLVRGVRSGIVHVNPPQGTTWRADVMPWGGVGESGHGREGVHGGLREMTEEKTVVVHPGDA